MEIFFNNAFPTFQELKSNLIYIEKELEKHPSTNNFSLMILPDYLLDYAMLRTMPEETEILIDNEIYELMSKYNKYIRMVYLGSKMIISDNKYLEKLYFHCLKQNIAIDNIENNSESNENIMKKLSKEISYREIQNGSIIEIRNKYDLALNTFLLNKKVKKEGVEILNTLNFKYTENLFYKLISLIANRIEIKDYVSLYHKITSSYIIRECGLVKEFLMFISAHSQKIGETYKYEPKKHSKRDVDMFSRLSFSGLPYKKNGNKNEKNDEKKYRNELLIDYIYRVYKTYYDSNKDITEIKNMLNEASAYSVFLHNLLEIWIAKKDFSLFKSNIEQAIENYTLFYEIVLDCIEKSLYSIYKKESLLLVREKISTFLVINDEDYLDWEKEIPTERWKDLETMYPDQYDDYISSIMETVAQLMFNLADNNCNVEPLSGKKISDMEGYIGYGIKLINRNIEPSVFLELLEIERYKLLNNYKKRLLAISEITRIPDYYKVTPEDFKIRISNYFA